MAESTPARIAWALFLACLVAVPLTITAPVAGGSGIPLLAHDPDIAKFIVALLLVPGALFAWAVSLGDSAGVRVSAAFVPLGGALAWIALSSLAAPDPMLALLGDGVRYEGFVAYVLYGVVFFLGVQLVDSPRRVRRVAEVLVVAATVGALHGVLQFLGVDPLGHGTLGFEANRAFGTLGNPDYFSLWLVLALPVSLSLAFTASATRLVVAWWSTSIAIMLGLLVSFTRGGWIGAAVALGALAWATRRSGWRAGRLDLGMIGGGTALAIGAALVSAGTDSPVTRVLARVGSIASFSDGSALSRLATWRSALAAIAERPVFGFGPDSFMFAFSRHRLDAYTRVAGASQMENNAHNLPLQLAATVGVLGALLVLGTIAYVLVRSWRYSAGAGRSGERLVLAGVWAGCAGSLVALLFGVSVIGVAVPLWALLGALASPSATTRAAGRFTGLIRSLAGVAAVLGVALALSLGMADAASQRSIVTLGTQASVDSAARAVKWAPFSTGYRAQLGVAHSILMAAELEANGGAVTAGAQRSYDAARVALEPVASARRYDFEVWFELIDTDLRYAYARGDEASFRRAQATAEQAIGYLPDVPLLQLGLGTAQLELGDTAAAKRAAETVLEHDPTYPPALGLLQAAESRQ